MCPAQGVGGEFCEELARHDMAVYTITLAYRGLFALLPFAVFLVAVLSFLRVDAVLLGWQSRVHRGCAGVYQLSGG